MVTPFLLPRPPFFSSYTFREHGSMLMENLIEHHQWGFSNAMVDFLEGSHFLWKLDLRAFDNCNSHKKTAAIYGIEL